MSTDQPDRSGADALAPEGLVGEEPMGRRTSLPWNFRCMEDHWHTVSNVTELVHNAPRCLLERIALEWAML